MSAPKEIELLVDRFDPKSPLNETQVRREFIDPFFKALGWDVANEQGAADAYKDVIHEDAIKVGGATKAPDYCFRIGGTRKFFVEAKKPSIDLKTEPSAAYQLRRYAWSAKLPLSILTDFEEFAVYDCRKRPVKGDKPSHSRILYFTYDQYADKWEELSGIFSHDAVLKGSFDKYAASRKKRGTDEVDDAFLKEIEKWRELLAKNIALRNSELTQRELNFAVQRTIDRIIFLRICEDRSIEDYNRLMGICNGPNVYKRLCEYFYRADERYNSGLFHFQQEKGRPDFDSLTPKLNIDDATLKKIIGGLYYPDSPYEFSILPASILGQVYEQFLGKVIYLTKGHHAKIEDKPEVKKAGGVYYTPEYIVDYIVDNTLGKMLEGKAPKQVEKIKVLDPACGSGSFLINAYQKLIDWHRDYYLRSKQPKDRRHIYQGPGGLWFLSTAEKKRILLNNIYGVDIDEQAVEVSKLSLLLKVLEGETDQTINAQMKLFHANRALPDLGNNIKCGNSLIGPDFYESKQQSFLDDEEARRINVFDWNAEFQAIMKSGGFDVVIGNPPYVRQELLSDLKQYFEAHYEAFASVADLYAYFMEKGIKLLRDSGLFSIIVSSSFLRATYGAPLRETLKKHATILRLVDFGGLAIFKNAKDTYVCIPLLQKSGKQARVEVSKVERLDFASLADHVSQHYFTIPNERLSVDAWALKSDKEAAVFTRIMKIGKPLRAYVDDRIHYGIKTGLNDAFVIDDATRNQLIKQDKKSAELIKPLLGGQNIRRYVFNETGLWLIFTRRGVDISRYPAIRNHLARWKEDLTPKLDKGVKKGRKPGSYAWYEIQDDVAYYEVFDGPKLIYPDIAKGPRFCIELEGHYLTNTAYCLGTDDRYLLGVLNSRLFWFAISNISIPFGVRAGQYRYRLIYQYMEKVPIRELDLANAPERKIHERMVELVEIMLAQQKQLVSARTSHGKTIIQRQIEATDRGIDKLVYELYGLTEEEIMIVEETMSQG